VQGGEVSGSIDESARHAITKFAQYHFPATKGSVENLLGMGERPETILGFGCPSSDIARTLDRQLLPEVVNLTGAGCEIDVSARYLLVVYHPTTTEFGDERAQMEAVLEALGRVKIQTVLLWPNIDAGSDHISKAIRIFRDHDKPDWLRVITNLMPERYLQVLANAACAVGNSSSFVRDSSYFGTPIVNVGTRQSGRERAENVLDVGIGTGAIEAGIRRQLAHGRYAPSTLYGDGYVSRRIVESLAQLEPYIQKRLHTPAVSAAVR
jgi:UDP-hydrolysing UDP-N-acetyl-D-glucosamine 2-epimerase